MIAAFICACQCGGVARVESAHLESLDSHLAHTCFACMCRAYLPWHAGLMGMKLCPHCGLCSRVGLRTWGSGGQERSADGSLLTWIHLIFIWPTHAPPACARHTAYLPWHVLLTRAKLCPHCTRRLLICKHGPNVDKSIVSPHSNTVLSTLRNVFRVLTQAKIVVDTVAATHPYI